MLSRVIRFGRVNYLLFLDWLAPNGQSIKEEVALQFYYYFIILLLSFWLLKC